MKLKSVTSPQWSPVIPAALVAVVGVLLYYRWDNWWVNWDGGSYLYIARSLVEGEGLVFPDGSPALNRGPGYPLLLAAGLGLLETSARSAIWASRVVLIGGGALIAFLVSRWRGGLIAPVAAGVAAIVPALVLESGGWYFVPDGMVAVLVLVAIAVVVAGERDGLAVPGALAGLALALAVMTKESAALYVPVVPLVLWARGQGFTSRVARGVGAYLVTVAAILLVWASITAALADDRLIPWSVGLFVPVLGLITAVGLVLVFFARRNGGAAASVWEVGLFAGLLLVPVSAGLLWALGEPVIREPAQGLQSALDSLAYLFGWAWIPAMVLLVAGIAVGRRFDRPELWLAGVLLVGVGLGQALYSGTAHLSMRNAVGGVFGLAILIGVLLQEQAKDSDAGRWLTYGAVFLFLLAAAFATERVDGSTWAKTQSWDNPAVEELSQWLSASPAPTAAVMPMYATYVWFLGGDLPKPELVDLHFAPVGRAPYQREDLCHRIWWAGAMRECPAASELAVAQSNRRVVSTIFDDSLRDGPPVLVVTGNLETPSAHDGSGLLYLIEKHGLGLRLFATSEQHLPHWAVAYQMDEARLREAPAVVQEGLNGLESLAGSPVSFNESDYQELLRQVLP